MLRFEPMSQIDFTEHQSETLADYASNLVKADGGSLVAAESRAAQAFLKVLPKGQHTPDQYFFTLIEPKVSTPVGSLWLAEVTTARGREAYIYNIIVRPEHRGQGYGTRALQAAEEWASEMGLQHISLQVFGHNTSAQRLYKREGYQPTRVYMTKSLT